MPCGRCCPRLAILSEDELESILARIEPIKIGALFYRTVPCKYHNSVDSVAGALEHGGRFNPPLNLAQTLCNLENGFGLLYTATNPLTCLFECGHVLRGGLQEGEFQSIPVEPTVLVSFKVEAENALDLRNPAIQESLGIESARLSALDHRSVLNPRGSLTQLQSMGTALYKNGRFGGILTASRFGDIIPSFCFDFRPDQVRCELQDQTGVLKTWQQ